MTDEHEPDREADSVDAAPVPEPSIIDAPTPDAEAQFVAETAAHSRQTRIGWEVVVGAVVVMLVGAGIAFALLGQDAESEKPADKPTAAAVIPTRTPSLTATGSATTSRTTAASGTSAPGGVQSNRTATPTEKPAVAGQPLAELSAPPVQTVAMLVVPKGFRDATFGIVFQPFGWGPGGADGGRLLVKISSSEPTNASGKSLGKDFKARNASVWVSPPDARILVKGGTYTGVLTVRPQGDVGSLYLSKVRSVK